MIKRTINLVLRLLSFFLMNTYIPKNIKSDVTKIGLGINKRYYIFKWKFKDIKLYELLWEQERKYKEIETVRSDVEFVKAKGKLDSYLKSIWGEYTEILIQKVKFSNSHDGSGYLVLYIYV